MIWGDGTGGTDTYTKFNPANSVDVNVTIYGRVPPLQDARVGVVHRLDRRDDQFLKHRKCRA